MFDQLYTAVIMTVSFSGLFSFCLNYSYLLESLLSLELLAVSVYWLLSSLLKGLGVEELFSLFYLIMVVSESVLGLALLVMMSYSHSSVQIKSMSSSVC
uniref:NADH-ubiquinone oxidoreductase chain 4L n=1 Tax=Epimeria cornigera TaxID=1582882 RepID=A0A2S1TMC5_9CRUS|nr:NADH dehydrogenase subunit 4L [Epimeria cornigera]